ncbi:nucleotide exchange factor GrpE [Myxococcus sp. CA051A]|uniref:Protein GrpE n=1 Tax=Myxococcus llanfairpwllgwyngyllgogerychwyrndrobwllllantysiliogogogochensis TaxID=2590453 RepID=A0A540X1G8_9BACT|nr:MULTISPECIES: nucleotide exchange factor GrpE [Myxococcus]NTX02040.1 nucleotide exchange factor GrpE [Myxococcus sp. CA040A]NTX14479.1 nucleotide exchange factor GrpE [Myxococcus sp. CA056]NTX41115.1 nucleotide exchange factor GrpE [Myxococcus sp. CA033]NTX53491.1 nucleotide exchange factor GrpE [Myxococcus sp. CA039A]NTX64227.1 nucleotide exchange factor GrpE [Myxococcus sp. CA051A]
MSGNSHTDASQEAQHANGGGPPGPDAGEAAARSEEAEARAPADDVVSEAADAEKERLRADLEASRRRVDELARAYQAVNKDREEFKQRLTRERERMMDVERGNVAVSLLEAIDELDRALSMSAQDSSALAQGVRMIRDSLLAKAQGMGIERVTVVGQPYDPNVAEATDMEITTSPDEDQKVVAEFRAAYRLKDRVIRPARVKVAKYVAPAQA